MSSPQKEHGYTAIANEIMEALARINISGRDFNVLILVLRKTYGFNKKVDFISLSQISKHCNISVIRASQVMKRLILSKILTIKENLNGIGKSYCFNKHYNEWNTLKKNLNPLGKPYFTLKEKLNQPLRKTLSTKDIYTKETIQKTITPIIPLNKSPEFLEAWKSFLEMRKSIKSAPTDNARLLLLKKLESFSSDESIQIKIINQSTMNSYKGFFELKEAGYGKSRQDHPKNPGKYANIPRTVIDNRK